MGYSDKKLVNPVPHTASGAIYLKNNKTLKM